ncbi:MAG: ROK family protein [Williamsia herbipolensis]|nr:ROK family protein [Williamsia herbipolensis]
MTRQELLAATGMSRTTLFERLDGLFQHGLVYPSGSSRSPDGSPGRRAEILRWDDRGKVVLVLDLGQTRARVCVTTVHGQILRMQEWRQGIDTDAECYLEQVHAMARSVLAATGDPESLVGVGVGIPGPVNSRTGVLGRSTTMPQWQQYPLWEREREVWQVDVVIDNDARAAAAGEATMAAPHDTVLTVKFATGIGAGLVSAGHLVEGADGAAGDIGHVRSSVDGPLCTCGRHGCLASWASGAALIRDLAGRGVRTIDDIVAGVSAEDPDVLAAVDAATERLATVLAPVVAAVNPDALLLVGTLGRLPRVVARLDELIREDVTERAREHLVVSAGRLGADGAVAGLTRRVVDLVFAPDAIDAQVARSTG